MTPAEIRAHLDALNPDARGALRGTFASDANRFVASFEPLDSSFADPNGARASALASLLNRLPGLIERCADDLLQVYNSAWADEDPDEGTPPMDQPAFIAYFSLASVNLLNDLSASVAFDVGDLFAGHQVVLSLDPALQVQGRASLWG